MSNNTLPNSIRSPRRRDGFTLVELMVVVVIIAILGSIIMFAMFNAQDTAREAKTRNMIAKLNALIMARYESYMSRRVPIPPNVVAPNAPARNQQLAFIRLHMLREIMRMEMPDRWTDVLDGPVTGIRRPAVNQTYLRKISAANNGAGVTNGDGFQGAECLYMIITFGLDDADAITNFSQSDVGDSDNDGLPEFLDGWGRPISFIRWPAGFTSALQTRAVDEPDPASPTKDFDQFNPRRINDLPNGVPSSRAPPSKKHPRRFVLYPLVYSGGPDRKYDLAIGAAPFSYSFKVGMVGYVDPYLYIPSPQGKFQVGAPEDLDGDGSLDNGDNIHNHDLTVR